ncbi:MAG: isocitrate dehydrogenase (NADP(+)) [Euryarchaeota archaeon]|nr:isocitrate dehydrogenase (NADP(+)) [Euryarchaeota archaeon]
MKLEPPAGGHSIRTQGDRLAVPDDPIIPLIHGDGIGPDVTGAATRVLVAAVQKAYGGRRSLHFWGVAAGEASQAKYGELLPQATIDAIREHIVALKGPLTTPVGGGFRSLNVTLRQTLDLYANVRPIYYIPGVPSPMKHPEKMDMTIFREATEDVYAGIEWPQGSESAKKLIKFLRDEFNVRVREDSGIGVKPMSEFGTKRLVRKAIRYAIEHGRRSVTLVHKGNIMKYTEGAFRDWGYEVARDEFGDHTITEQEVAENYMGTPPKGKVVIKDRIADNMLQQLVTRTEEYDVLALPNLNGDYISDAAAAQVGGLGVAQGANIGDFVALFEPVHGSAPKYAGQDKVNPTAEILAGQMLLDYIGWKEAAAHVLQGVNRTIAAKIVTYDLARQMEGAKEVRCSQFADAVIERL